MVITTGPPDDDVNPQRRQEVQFQRQRHVFEGVDFSDQEMRRHHLQIDQVDIAQAWQLVIRQGGAPAIRRGPACCGDADHRNRERTGYRLLQSPYQADDPIIVRYRECRYDKSAIR